MPFNYLTASDAELQSYRNGIKLSLQKVEVKVAEEDNVKKAIALDLMDARCTFEDIVRAVSIMNVPENLEDQKVQILQKSKEGVKSLVRILDVQTVYLKDGASVAVEFSDNDAGFGFSAEQEKKLKEIKKKKEDERKEKEKAAKEAEKSSRESYRSSSARKSNYFHPYYHPSPYMPPSQGTLYSF